jgi:mannose-6-phosphate isomerase-like protein (cupin superfamily)
MKNNTKTIRSAEFTAARAWGALDIAKINGATVRLHWTDQPYKWHVNDGQEVFAVLNGVVDMHYRDDSGEHIALLNAGDLFFADIGCKHVAHPRGEARILVIETEGSV